jgi:cysteine synthase A
MLTGSMQQIVGQTPLLKIKSLSDATGCEIFGKAEFLNPGGSVKDRAALYIIKEAEKSGHLKKGDTIVEGTAGNTGIGLGTLAPERGYKCLIVMPNNLAREKTDTLKALGCELVLVPPVLFSDENHFFHTAGRLAKEKSGRFWANQFENMANYRAHFETTAPEIYEQMNGKIDAFVAAAGTGGTIAGVSVYLKEKNPETFIRLVDPMGSGLFEFVKSGQMTGAGTTITEGIGIMRLTSNFKAAKIDDAKQVSDQDMLNMVYHLAENDGLLVGTSAALNVFGAYQYALEHKNSGRRIVTILCDSALRYQSKVFNDQYLATVGLTPRQPLS